MLRLLNWPLLQVERRVAERLAAERSKLAAWEAASAVKAQQLAKREAAAADWEGQLAARAAAGAEKEAAAAAREKQQAVRAALLAEQEGQLAAKVAEVAAKEAETPVGGAGGRPAGVEGSMLLGRRAVSDSH